MKQLMKQIAAWTSILTLVFVLLHIKWPGSLFLTLSITCGTTAYHFLMRLAVGYLIDRHFHNQIDPSLSWFRPFPFEEKFYRRLKVGKWKHHIPTYDPIQFSMKDRSPEEIAGAMCQAEVVHETIIVFSFLPIAFSRVFDSFWVFLITSVMAALFDLTFVILQRFNRPRVMNLIRYMQKRRPQI